MVKMIEVFKEKKNNSLSTQEVINNRAPFNNFKNVVLLELATKETDLMLTGDKYPSVFAYVIKQKDNYGEEEYLVSVTNLSKESSFLHGIPLEPINGIDMKMVHSQKNCAIGKTKNDLSLFLIANGYEKELVFNSEEYIVSFLQSEGYKGDFSPRSKEREMFLLNKLKELGLDFNSIEF